MKWECRLWDDIQPVTVGGFDHCEMTFVGRGHGGDAETLGCGYHGSVNGAEGKIVVFVDEFGDARPVVWRHRFGLRVAYGEIADELYVCVRSWAAADEVADFCDHRSRYEQ